MYVKSKEKFDLLAINIVLHLDLYKIAIKIDEVLKKIVYLIIEVIYKRKFVLSSSLIHDPIVDVDLVKVLVIIVLNKVHIDI